MGSKDRGRDARRGDGEGRDLRAQLQQWKAVQPTVQPPAERSSERAARAPSSAPRAKQHGDASGKPAVEERPLTDEELFLNAVEAVADAGAAILKKYDRTDVRTVPSSGAEAETGDGEPVSTSERALFLQAVGDLTPLDVARAKPGATAPPRGPDVRFARRAQRGEVEPRATLDLHGDDRDRARGRLGAFLLAEQRVRTDVVLVVHGRGTGTLASEVAELLDEHEAVAEHVTAPKGLGGEGARLVRLKAKGARGR